MSAADIRSLWATLYPSAAPTVLHELPSCAQHLKVFVYNLSFPLVWLRADNGTVASTQANMLRLMEARRGAANCDYARSPCHEKSASNTGNNTDYSNLRQYAAEVPILAKLLLLPQTRRAADAHLFVVPWLASTELQVFGTPWDPLNPAVAKRFWKVRSQLTHYKHARKRRHIFLSTRDLAFSVTDLRDEVARSGALLLHYGPLRPNASNDIVVAPNSAGFGAPLAPLVHPAPHFLFAMMDETINAQRKKVGAALRLLNASRSDVHYLAIGDHRTMRLSPEEAHAVMVQSLVCPIVQARHLSRRLL